MTKQLGLKALVGVLKACMAFSKGTLSSCLGKTGRGLLPAEMFLSAISNPLRAGHGWWVEQGLMIVGSVVCLYSWPGMSKPLTKDGCSPQASSP